MLRRRTSVCSLLVGSHFRCTSSTLAHILEIFADVWDVVVVSLSSRCGASLCCVALGDAFQIHQVVRAQLVDDTRQQLFELFVLSVARNDEGVRLDSCLYFRCAEMQHCAILLEHIHLLDAWDLVHAHTLELSLELLVVRCVRCMLLDLSTPYRALATSPHVADARLQLLAGSQYFRRGIHDAGPSSNVMNRRGYPYRASA